MKIAFPNTNNNVGPMIFLRRLKESIDRQGIARTTHWYNPWHDIGLYAVRSRNIFGRPFALRLDGIYFDQLETLGPNHELNKPIFAAIGAARGLVFNADHCRRLVEAFYPGKLPANTVINNGVDLRQFRDQNRKQVVRDRLNIPDDAFVLVISAHWRKWKRLDDHIAAFEKVLSEAPDTHLIVLGKNAESVKGAKNIHHVGEIAPENLADCYRAGDAYLLLSYLEASANTMVEAIASELPVVIANSGGGHELVEKCQAGIVVGCDPGYEYGKLVRLYDPPSVDPEKVARAIRTIRQDLPAFRKKTDRSHIDINDVARRYVDFLRSLI